MQSASGARSFADALPQFEHASSFGALGARCTQFCPTVHADEARCTQFFASHRMMGTSSTCAFDASRSFRGLRKCVYRTPFACSVGRNCVYRASVACSVPAKLRVPFVGSLRQNPEPQYPILCLNPPATHVAALCKPNPNRVARAPNVFASHQRPPHPLPCLSRQQPTQLPCVS